MKNRTIKVKHRLSILYGDATVELGDNLTPVVSTLFSSGQCHALAVGLHELLNWKIGVCIDYRDEETHFVVCCPSGGFVDIYGCSPTAGGVRIEMCEPGYVLTCYRQFHFLKPNMILARHFAPLVVAKYGLSEVAA
jgi:hypothetical protein